MGSEHEMAKELAGTRWAIGLLVGIFTLVAIGLGNAVWAINGRLTVVETAVPLQLDRIEAELGEVRDLLAALTEKE